MCSAALMADGMRMVCGWARMDMKRTNGYTDIRSLQSLKDSAAGWILLALYN
jgi:hypothetical protein